MRTNGLVGILFMCMVIGLIVSPAAAQTRAVTPASSVGIQILSPVGGESLVLGNQYPIRWKSAKVTGNVSIALFQNKKLVGTIIKSCPVNKNGYLWPAGRLVKGTARAGSGYTIGIRSVDNAVKSYSPEPFSLTAASSAAGTSHSGIVSGSGTTADLPTSSSSGQAGVSAPVNTHTASPGSIPQSGMTLQGAPVTAQGTSVQRIVDMHFTNPQGGVIWEKGRTYTISWDKTGGIGSVKIQLNDLLNQSSHWVSQGTDHVINNTGNYSFTVPSSFPDSAFFLQIMTTDGSYTNKSDKFYISRTDTDLKVKAVNFGKKMEYIGAKDMPLNEWRYLVSEIWLENKGTKRLSEVKVTWKIIRMPSGRVVKQGEKTFEDLTPGSWYQQNLKELYHEINASSPAKWGFLKDGETFDLILYADFDNDLRETEFTRNDNTYQTEVITQSTFW